MIADRTGSTGGGKVIEVKRRLDGSEQRFDCELVYRTPWMAVVLIQIEWPWGAKTGMKLDSYGLFWRRRSYNCYYMVRPGQSQAVVTRFDVVRDVELDVPGEVRYVDLLLDLWVDDRGPHWEDEEDVSYASSTGLLSTNDLARIRRARAVLERRHINVASEVRSLLRGLGRIPL